MPVVDVVEEGEGLARHPVAVEPQARRLPLRVLRTMRARRVLEHTRRAIEQPKTFVISMLNVGYKLHRLASVEP